MSGTRILEGAREALAVAKGEEPATVLHHNGHAYVPAATLKEVEAENTRLRSLNAELVDENERLKKTIGGCQWFWPEGDTTEDNCAFCSQEVVESLYGWCTPTGEVVAVARGGVVEITHCAALPPAEDADSDDEFWVEEATHDAAKAKIDAELERRALLARANGGGNG